MWQRGMRTNDDDDKIFPSKNLLKRIVSTKAESKHGNRKGKTKRGVQVYCGAQGWPIFGQMIFATFGSIVLILTLGNRNEVKRLERRPCFEGCPIFGAKSRPCHEVGAHNGVWNAVTNILDR